MSLEVGVTADMLTPDKYIGVCTLSSQLGEGIIDLMTILKHV
jgi:hypothetical protein